MSWCETGSHGIAGVERMSSQGTLPRYRTTLGVLQHEDYRNNPDAILALVDGTHFAQRELSSDERSFLFSTISLIGSRNIELCRSQSKAGTILNRLTATLSKFPANYVRDKTQTGAAFVGAYKDYLGASDVLLGCSDPAESFLLDWPDLLRFTQHRRRDHRDTLMDEHADQKSIDVAADGTPNRFAIRGVMHFGRGSTVRLAMKLVWAEPTGKTLPNGRPEYKGREKMVGSCDIPLDGPFGIYFFSSVGAGRHAGWAMRDPEDGVLKLVVLFHSSKLSNDESTSLVARGIINTDRTFDTQEKASQYFADMALGNAALINIASFPEIDLSEFGTSDETAVARVDHILRSTPFFDPAPKDHLERATEEFSQLTEANVNAVYDSIDAIFSANPDGSDVSPDAKGKRWRRFRKHHESNPLFRLIEGRVPAASNHQERADAAFAGLTEENAGAVYSTIDGIFSANPDGSAVAAGTKWARWNAFRKQHESNALFRLILPLTRAASDHQQRADEAFAGLNETNVDEVYGTIDGIFSLKPDGSDATAETKRERWKAFRKQHESNPMFHLIGGRIPVPRAQSDHQKRADEAFAGLNETNVDEVYGTIDGIFSLKPDGSDATAETKRERWKAFRKRHESNPLFRLIEGSLPAPKPRKRKASAEKAEDEKERKKARHGQKRVAVTVTKPSADTKLGLGIGQRKGVSGVWVNAIQEGSLFSNTDLRMDMAIESVNGERYETFAECLALLKAVVGQLTIIVKK